MNNQIKIVIADDHPMLLNGLKAELIDQGYDVINTASNGAQALDLIGKAPPDIAIVDISMPL